MKLAYLCISFACILCGCVADPSLPVNDVNYKTVQEREIYMRYHRRGTITAYEQFIATHPNNSYVDAAREEKRCLQKYGIPRDIIRIGGNLTVGQIIDLHRNRMGDELIIANIEASQGGFKNFSPEEVALLQKTGLSDRIIAAMIEKDRKEKLVAKQKLERCYNCSGKGFLDCRLIEIRGNEEIACAICHGTGKKLCGHCGGRGVK